MSYTHSSVLRGAKFRPMEAQNVAAELEGGQEVHLVADHDNEYDQFAVRVMAESERGSGHFDQFIGFIHKATAPKVQPLLDAGEAYSAEVYEPNGLFSVIGWEFPNVSDEYGMESPDDADE